MIKEELYHKTVDILYQAYFDNTLEHGTCTKCAVGNLVAANLNLTITNKHCVVGIRRHKSSFFNGNKYYAPHWSSVFVTITYGSEKIQELRPEKYHGESARQIDATGYSWGELAMIENAFETAEYGDSEEDWMFNGLSKVLDILRDIHQVTDEDLIQGNNKRFKDHYQKKVSQV